MNIVIDTNILVSAVFFGGFPGRIVKAVTEGKLDTFVSKLISEEYREIVEGFKEKNSGKFNENLFENFLKTAKSVKPRKKIQICRDPDDDKFIECAVCAKAFYIVSGDKDLLVLERYGDVEIITAKDFCEKHLEK